MFEGARPLRLTLGPLPGDAARAWLRYADDALERVRQSPRPFAMPPEVVAEFRSYLDAWATAATAEVFSWKGEADAARVRTLMTYWLNMAQFMADGVIEDRPMMTPPAEDFYEAVVTMILAALGDEEPAAEVIGERWPLRASATAPAY
jgi:hypothetical protein